jgi:transposase
VNFDGVHDPEMLRQAVGILDQENRKLIEQVLELKRKVRELEGKEPQQLALEVSELERQLQIRNRMLFGERSEKRGPKHPASETEREQPGHGPRPQPALPLLETRHVLDDADRVCSSCGGELQVWEGQTEDSEEIESIQRCFIRVLHKRQKYRCACGGCIETALGPKKLIVGGRYAPSVAVHIAVDKYSDHLPLERQARIMTRQGLVIESQTLWDQIDALAKHLTPAYERLHSYVLDHGVLGADETPWRLMGHQGKASKRWYAWALCAPNAVIYRLDESRSAEAGRAILRTFAGTLVCDGYTAYSALQKQGASFRIAHCWAHVRRKFIEAEQSAPTACKEILDLIGELYAVEREMKESPPDELLAARQTRSKAVLQKIQRWALQTKSLPQSALGKAIGYMSSLWPGLQVFIDDPRVSPDNNSVERALRSVVLGRKNHYGSRSKRGTEVAALFYSLLESAKLADVDPEQYLKVATRAALDGVQIPLPHEITLAS